MKPGAVPRIIGGAPDDMFNCKDSIDSLLHFLDGELSAEDEAHLKEHLSGCPPCVDFVNTYRATSGMCRRALVRNMAPEVGSRLQAFLRSKLAAK